MSESPSDTPSHVVWHEEPGVTAPILVIALEGLFDIAGAATDAVDHLAGTAASKRKIASIDPEVFFDFTQQRPVVSLGANGTRTLTWPENDAYEITISGEAPDIVVVSGIEPHLRWRTFSEAVGEIASRCGARLVVTLGAMAGLAPHTRTLGVVGSASDAALATRLGLGRPSYEGPTGLVGALHVRLHELGLAVISLRVSVPHYITQAPNAEATRSLLARFELVTGVETGHHSFDEAAADWRSRVDAAVASDDDMKRYVTQLEAQVDSTPDLLPDGDALAAELQAWLRDNDGDDDTDHP
ncbi:MAG: PAC2 family protein [Actinomycetota bacterium]